MDQPLIDFSSPEITEAESLSTPAERRWALIGHLGAFVGYLIPLANIAVPLIVWLTQKKSSPFVARHARESLNFQICLTGLMFVIALAAAYSTKLAVTGLFLALYEVWLVGKASYRAHKGEHFPYPWAVQFVK